MCSGETNTLVLCKFQTLVQYACRKEHLTKMDFFLMILTAHSDCRVDWAQLGSDTLSFSISSF